MTSAPLRRASVVVHGDDGAGGRRTVGSLGPALTDLGFTLDVVDLDRDEPPPVTAAELVVVMGSDASAYDDTVPWLATELRYLERVTAAGIPVLGVCFGGQALARVLGGRVGPASRAEHGLVPVRTSAPDLIAPGPWMESHSDAFTLPPGARPLASTDVCLQAFAAGPHLGLQFHPEITPDAFATWVEQWNADGALPALRDQGLDLDAVTRQIGDDAADLAARCRVLVRSWCAGAGLL